MSDKTSRRGLFDFARRAARAAEPEPVPEPLPEAEASEVAEPETPPWARRAAAAAAPRPASVARVLAFACLGGSPSFCSTCVEHCPIDGALELTQRAPRVNADLCDGCGICERVCPAPERAIVVLPRLPGGKAK